MSRTKAKKTELQITMPVSTLKQAFRQTFPGQSAQELLPLWLKFWGQLYPQARVESVQRVEVVFPLGKEETS